MGMDSLGGKPRLCSPCFWCGVSRGGSAALLPPWRQRRLRSQPQLRGKTSAPLTAHNSGPTAENPGKAWRRQNSAGSRRRPERPGPSGGGGRRPPCPRGLRGNTTLQRPPFVRTCVRVCELDRPVLPSVSREDAVDPSLSRSPPSSCRQHTNKC